MTQLTHPFDGRHVRPLRSQSDLPTTTDTPVPVHDATDLTAGGILAHIRLDAQTYTLRITRQGKLILTK
jgi:hemin uptake protein HemP